jgi:Arc/MetJ-type ribon-helix-helix transcriptional regulator
MKSPKVSFRIPETTLLAIDQLIKNKVFRSKSEFFHVATEKLLKTYAEYEASLKEATQ